MNTGIVKLTDVAEINPRFRNGAHGNDEEVAFVPMAAISAENASVEVLETRALSTVINGFTYFQDGDILVAKITPCFENGKIAQARIAQRYGFGSTEFHVLRVASSKLDARYLLHFLRQPRIRIEGERRMTGSAGQRRVPKHFLEGLQLLLPPLVDQRRIAAILDSAEGLRARLRRALFKLSLLTQSVFLDFFGDPAGNPKGLPTIPLGEIARFVGGGTPSRAVAAYYSGEICWATSKDMKGELLRDTQEHITEQAIKESATNLVQSGTILVVVKSKILMHRLPVLIATVPTCFGQDLKGIILKQPWSARYIARHLRLGQKWLLDRARGANTEGLTLDHLREYPVIVPPPALNERYEKIEQTIELQRERMKKSLTKLDMLFASLQHRAFEGEL